MTGKVSKERESTACKTCARAKVRCEIEPQKDVCRRCQRLGKVCERQPPGAHKKTIAVGRWSRADLLRLESKVDSVSNLLSAASHASPHNSQTPTAESESTSSHSPPQQVVLPNDSEASRLFGLFRSEMAPLFPFVPVAPDLTHNKCRDEKPLLHLAIMTVASQNDLQQQLDLARSMRQEISQAVLVRSERNIGLLQGILVFLGWNHIHHQLGAQVLNLIHILISMIYELDLNKEPNTRTKTSAGAIAALTDQIHERDRTLDERRAYLGVFYLSSMVKTYLKELEGIRFTEYANNCCRLLEEAGEHPSDYYLVRLVRLQQQADRIGRILYTENFEGSTRTSASMCLAISSLEKEVAELEYLTVTDIPQQALLHIAHQMLKVHLFKVSLDDRLFPASRPTTHTNLPPFPFDPRRAHLLESCLSTIQSLTNPLFSLPPKSLLSLPYPFWAPAGHMMLILSRLSEVHHGAWDPTYVSETLDFKTTSRMFVAMMEDAMAVGREMSPPRYLPEMFVFLMNRFKELGEPAEGSSEGPVVGPDLGSADLLWDDWMMNGIIPDLFDVGLGQTV